METPVYTFRLNLDWALLGMISSIDRFDASWSAIERREGQSLRQLKTVATIRSVGASTRIEGSLMSDNEVEVLLNRIDITSFESRDQQEVRGYFDALDLISEAYMDIPANESNMKNLHNVLLKYSTRDKWHKGNYKQHSNAVEATYPDGRRHIIFETTEAGVPTQEAMRALVRWFRTDQSTHPLVKCALFAYEFLSIHPFQDGNGRLSRLLSTLLLMRQGYTWIQYVSFEHEIEHRKSEYYRVLRNCQGQRPGENISEWVSFFLSSLASIQHQLLRKLEQQGMDSQLAPKEKAILTYIAHHPGCRSGMIARSLNIPTPTIKRMLGELLNKRQVEKHGSGPGTNYTIN